MSSYDCLWNCGVPTMSGHSGRKFTHETLTHPRITHDNWMDSVFQITPGQSIFGNRDAAKLIGRKNRGDLPGGQGGSLFGGPGGGELEG